MADRPPKPHAEATPARDVRTRLSRRGDLVSVAVMLAFDFMAASSMKGAPAFMRAVAKLVWAAHRNGRLLVADNARSCALWEVRDDGSWYLVFIAAFPRGRGVGTQVLRDFLRRADAAGAPVILHCAQARVGWYRRHGFSPTSYGVDQDDVVRKTEGCAKLQRRPDEGARRRLNQRNVVTRPTVLVLSPRPLVAARTAFALVVVTSVVVASAHAIAARAKPSLATLAAAASPMTPPNAQLVAETPSRGAVFADEEGVSSLASYYENALHGDGFAQVTTAHGERFTATVAVASGHATVHIYLSPRPCRVTGTAAAGSRVSDQTCVTVKTG